MKRWFARWMSSDAAKPSPDRKGRKKPAAKRNRRKTKTDYRHPPAPLTWNNPEQDFITRYGDPFDG